MQETVLAFSAYIECTDGLQHLILVYSNYSKHCAALTIRGLSETCENSQTFCLFNQTFKDKYYIFNLNVFITRDLGLLEKYLLYLF